MIYLGDFWSQHITTASLNEIWDWYGWNGYPTKLRREIERRYTPRPEDRQPMDARTYDRVLRQVKEYARMSVEAYNLPDHNMVHFSETAKAMTDQFEAVYGPAARTGPLLAVRQALEIAGWLHDCHHSGCTLRIDSIKPLYRPELGTNVSVEYVSAVAANDFLTWIGLPLPWRIFIVNEILASTFGGKIAQDRGITNIPVIHTPTTLYHAMMRVCDVWPKPDIHSELQKAINVNVHEIPAGGKTTDPVQLLRDQAGFQGYRLSEMRNLDMIVGKQITLACQQECTRRAEVFQQAADGDRPDLVDYVAGLMAA